MISAISPVSFGDLTMTRYEDGSKIVESFNDNIRLKRLVYDSKDRIVDSVCFDNLGKKISHKHKEYIENGCIESYKDLKQEYVRRTQMVIEPPFKRFLEHFTSITSPDKSYVAEFIRTLENKLVKVIVNGKIINV